MIFILEKMHKTTTARGAMMIICHPLSARTTMNANDRIIPITLQVHLTSSFHFRTMSSNVRLSFHSYALDLMKFHESESFL